MTKTVDSYIKKNNEEYQRYNSWNHCYKAFRDPKFDSDYLALHLGFYLASWGMYRGSSGLLKKDYKVHIDGVNIIKTFYKLRCDEFRENQYNSINDILECIAQLSSHYNNHGVTPTDTLISKIMFGTLCCLPAFDRYFIIGVRQENKKFTTLKSKSMEKLFIHVDSDPVFCKLCSAYETYPKMKILDIYYWQLGFENM